MGDYLADKVIAVTGAGRGIGRGIALLCAGEGARVVVNDYGVAIDGTEPTSEVADGVVEEITSAGGTAVAVADSVTTMDGGQRIVQTGIDKWGRIDGVVCVAGILRERMLFNMSEAEWDPVIETHLKGTFTVFRAAAPIFRAQKSGMLFGMEEETEQCVADRQLAVDRREGGVDLPEIGAFDLLGVDLAARDRQDRLARPARLLLCTLECGLPLRGDVHVDHDIRDDRTDEEVDRGQQNVLLKHPARFLTGDGDDDEGRQKESARRAQQCDHARAIDQSVSLAGAENHIPPVAPI